MHKLKFVPKNEMCKILWDFEIQKDHLIIFRTPELVLINKTDDDLLPQ